MELTICKQSPLQKTVFSTIAPSSHCNSLHCTALHCTTPHCTALHRTELHCIALHCTVIHCTALKCSVGTQRGTVVFYCVGIVVFGGMYPACFCPTLMYFIVCTVQYCTVHTNVQFTECLHHTLLTPYSQCSFLYCKCPVCGSLYCQLFCCFIHFEEHTEHTLHSRWG